MVITLLRSFIAKEGEKLEGKVGATKIISKDNQRCVYVLIVLIR